MTPPSTPSGPARQLADLNLLRGQMDGIALSAAQPIPAASQSFGFFSNPLAEAEQTVAEILASIRQILAQLAPSAQVHTAQQGFTAITVVNYTGAASSLWTGDPPSTFAAAHLSSLQATLDLRLAVAGVIASAGTALAAISAALTNPLTIASAIQSAIALKHRLDALTQVLHPRRPA